MGRWGSKVPNFLVKIKKRLFQDSVPKQGWRWVGGGPESQINTWNFVRKTAHFLKKIKCSKQPKKRNKLNFYLSLSGVPNARSGWVGSDVWDNVPKKRLFFYNFPYYHHHNISSSSAVSLSATSSSPSVSLSSLIFTYHCHYHNLVIIIIVWSIGKIREGGSKEMGKING